jgi:hypothetical protein
MKRSLKIFGALLIVVATVGVTFYVRPRLYLLTFAGLGLAALALYGAVLLRRTRAGNICVTLLVIGLFLSVLDPVTAMTQSRDLTRFEGSWSYKYHYVGDSDLGMGLPPGVVAESRKFTGDHLDYDVVYSIDSNGHRLTAASNDPHADNVLFMGCSYTFGQGLNDNQALPQLFSALTDKRYNVINFGVPTYGLHQEVRTLELGRPEPLLTQGKRYIIYSAIADHANRAMAAYTWTVQGPAYRLGPDGIAQYYGNLNSVASGMVLTTLTRSLFIGNYVLTPFMAKRTPDPIPLYIGLVKRARQLAEQKYHASFIMIFWDDKEPLEPSVKAALDQAGIHYIPVTSIIPDLNSNPAPYRVSPFDPHPSEAANRPIAAYLAQHLTDGSLSQ